MIQEKTLKEEWTNKNYSNDNYSCIAPASLWILTYLNRCYEDRWTWNFFWIINLLWIWYHLYQRWVCKNVPVLNNKVWNFVHLKYKDIDKLNRRKKIKVSFKVLHKNYKTITKEEENNHFFSYPTYLCFQKNSNIQLDRCPAEVLVWKVRNRSNTTNLYWSTIHFHF